MIAELDALANLFRDLDASVSEIFERTWTRMGFTREMMVAALEETRAGKELEPLPRLRKLNKVETITRVYRKQNETIPSQHTLIFETGDSMLWQLCEVGLGWCPFREVDPGWTLARDFADFLPATIVPRPPTTVPWNYDLVFGKRVVLRIRLKENDTHPTFGLRIRT